MKKIIILVISLFGMISGAAAQTGTWSGTIEIQGTGLPVVFHLDGVEPTMDSPDQGAKGIPVSVDKGEFGRIVIRIPSIGASYEGKWMVRKIVGTFTQGGLSLPLTLVPGEMKRNRPQTPEGPFPYLTEEVSFTNGDATLRGTLVLPSEYTRSTPALVMVTGSGLQNRDEELFDHKPFAVIADALARAGIATLRYDDRGFGESTGNAVTATTEDFCNDALAGMELLRERFDRVGMIGHSEGGTIALMAASQEKADFIVSLAGMVISGKETLVSQNRTGLREAGFSEDVISIYCRIFEEAAEAIIAGTPAPSAENKDIPEALIQNYHIALQQLSTPYMKHFLALDMRELLGSISCPVLALNGTKDIQVDHHANLEALRQGLTCNTVSRIEALPELNHLFQHCSTGSVAEYKEIEESFATEALDMIISWLLSI